MSNKKNIKKNNKKTSKVSKINKKDKQKQIIMSLLPTFLFLLILIGGTYSLFSNGITGTKLYEITIGRFNFEIGDEANPIKLTGTYPMVDAAGLRTEPYTFKLTNSSGAKVNYTMELISDTENTLPDNLIKIHIEQDDKVVGPMDLETLTRTIYTGTMTGGESHNFSIRLWLDENATTDISGKTFQGKIKVMATQAIK